METKPPRRLAAAYDAASIGVVWMLSLVLSFLGILMWPYILYFLGYPDGEMVPTASAIVWFLFLCGIPAFIVAVIAIVYIWLRSQRGDAGRAVVTVNRNEPR